MAVTRPVIESAPCGKVIRHEPAAMDVEYSPFWFAGAEVGPKI